MSRAHVRVHIRMSICQARPYDTSGYGGGVRAVGSLTRLVLTGLVISDCEAGRCGGGLELGSGARATLRNSTLRDCYCRYEAGGICVISYIIILVI